MRAPLFIGLAGPARSGKSTAQQIIADRYGLCRVNFADPIKDALSAMLGLGDRHLEGDLKEHPLTWLGQSPRELMQTLGTEWGRDINGNDFWIRVAKRRLAALEDLEQEAYIGAVFSDVRFPQEAAFIRDHGGAVIQLHRHGTPQVRGHASERSIGVHPADLFVANHGDLEEFRARLTLAMDDIIARRVASCAG